MLESKFGTWLKRIHKQLDFLLKRKKGFYSSVLQCIRHYWPKVNGRMIIPQPKKGKSFKELRDLPILLICFHFLFIDLFYIYFYLVARLAFFLLRIIHWLWLLLLPFHFILVFWSSYLAHSNDSSSSSFQKQFFSCILVCLFPVWKIGQMKQQNQKNQHQAEWIDRWMD